VIRKKCRQLHYEPTLAEYGPDTDSRTEGRTPQNDDPETSNQVMQTNRKKLHNIATKR